MPKLDSTKSVHPHVATGEVAGNGLLLNHRGQPAYEVPDPVPVAPPIGYRRQPSMWEQMRVMMRAELELAEAEGFESPEEADDFEVGDDYDPSSPYEHSFDPPAEIAPAEAPLPPASEAANASSSPPAQPAAPASPPKPPSPPALPVG